MNTGSLKNIVILKDLPSNLVEEAIIFLKENQKLKKPELIDVENKKQNIDKLEKEDTKNYIVKEAQMLISEYITKIENKNKQEGISYKKLKRKYKNLKKLSVALSIGLIANITIIFVIL